MKLLIKFPTRGRPDKALKTLVRYINYMDDKSNRIIVTCDLDDMSMNNAEVRDILLGRTTIEGWMCGKGGWIYDVDSNGNIISKTFHEVPNDLNKFKSDGVATAIIDVYKSIL